MIRPSQPAEWLPARVVLLCEPRLETLFSILQTDSSNFLFPFSLAQAREEHQAYRRALEARGARVIDIRDALLPSPSGRRGARNLRAWAREAITLAPDASLAPDDVAHIERQLTRALDALDPASLVDVILLRPALRVAYNAEAVDPTTRFTTRFELTDPPSCYYTRDPLMTTARGVVITRLRLGKRRPENDIAAHALEQLGVTPIFRVQAPGTLEGGDFIPCGDFVLQGQGLLTNADAVGQCLERRVYGYTEVAVVRDPRGDMDEMHLDTYFAMLDRDLAACCSTRLSGPEEPEVDVHIPDGRPNRFAYTAARTVTLSAYLREKGVRVIPFSKREQENFAPNGLLVGPRHYIGVTRAGKAFQARLEKAGVRTAFIAFDALTGGYGGPHCSSQVLVRG